MENGERRAAIRAQWFADKRCVRCNGTEKLELDHIDPTTKVASNVWLWAAARREAEIAKCQVLCKACHIVKTNEERYGFTSAPHGSAAMWQRGCPCFSCKERGRQYKRASRARIKKLAHCVMCSRRLPQTNVCALCWSKVQAYVGIPLGLYAFFVWCRNV